MQPYQQKPFHGAYVVCHLSLFYNRQITASAFRTGVIYAVDLDCFQFRRDKDQFTPDEPFTDFYQRSITNRTELICIRKIEIFLRYRYAFETLGICRSGFSLFCFFFGKRSRQFFCFCRRWILFHFRFVEKIQLFRELRGTFFAGSPEKFLRSRLISSFRLSRSRIRASSRLPAASTAA